MNKHVIYDQRAGSDFITNRGSLDSFDIPSGELPISIGVTSIIFYASVYTPCGFGTWDLRIEDSCDTTFWNSSRSSHTTSFSQWLALV